MTQTPDCEHTLITDVDGEHRCADCGDPVELRTATGKIVTPTDIEQFVVEAEAGYDVTYFVGKPSRRDG